MIPRLQRAVVQHRVRGLGTELSDYKGVSDPVIPQLQRKAAQHFVRGSGTHPSDYKGVSDPETDIHSDVHYGDTNHEKGNRKSPEFFNDSRIGRRYRRRQRMCEAPAECEAVTEAHHDSPFFG